MGFKLSTMGNTVSRAVGLLLPILVRVEQSEGTAA